MLQPLPEGRHRVFWGFHYRARELYLLSFFEQFFMVLQNLLVVGVINQIHATHFCLHAFWASTTAYQVHVPVSSVFRGFKLKQKDRLFNGLSQQFA
jgi:hypothetical protein